MMVIDFGFTIKDINKFCERFKNYIKKLNKKS